MLPVEVNELQYTCHDDLPTLDHTPLISDRLPAIITQETSGEEGDGEEGRDGEDDNDSIPDGMEQKPLLDSS